MKKRSAGILLYKQGAAGLQVLLVHPGGPFWAKKDRAAWSIPKGEIIEDEDPLSAAQREFSEELGLPVPAGEALELSSVKQSSKEVLAWAIAANLDVKQIVSNQFEMEWPPRSGAMQSFPEVDKAAWFDLATAQIKLVKGQVALLEHLADHLKIDLAAPTEPSQATLF